MKTEIIAKEPTQNLPKKGLYENQVGRGSRKFTREDQQKFLRKYTECLDVREAARFVGFKKSTIYKQARKKAEFAEAMDQARTGVVTELQDKMINFARGREAPVHNAQLTAMFGVLKAYLPDRWRENAKVAVSAEGALATLLTGMAACLPDPNKIPERPALEAQV